MKIILALSLVSLSCGVQVSLPGLPPGVADELTPDDLPTCSEVGGEVTETQACTTAGLAHCYGGEGEGAWEVAGCRHGEVVCTFECP